MRLLEQVFAVFLEAVVGTLVAVAAGVADMSAARAVGTSVSDRTTAELIDRAAVGMTAVGMTGTEVAVLFGTAVAARLQRMTGRPVAVARIVSRVGKALFGCPEDFFVARCTPLSDSSALYVLFASSNCASVRDKSWPGIV